MAQLDCRGAQGRFRQPRRMEKNFGKKHHIYAALVKKERHMIRNVRDALAKAKQRGVVLGNPNVGKIVTEAIAARLIPKVE